MARPGGLLTRSVAFGFEFGFAKSPALGMNSGLPGEPRKAGRRSCGVDTVD